MLAAIVISSCAAASWAPLAARRAPPPSLVLYDRNGQPIDENSEDRQRELSELYGVQDIDGSAASVVTTVASTPPPTSAADAETSETQRLTELLADVADVGLFEASSDESKERILGRLKRRLRRGKDAKNLLDLADMLEERESEIMLLNREVSIASTMTDFWGELSAVLGKKQSQTVKRAGQAKVAEAVGRPLDKAGERLDQAWRRDALRAILALQRAPEALEGELRKQRLAKLQPEIKMLGLQRKSLESITEMDLRAAKKSRARELHPDLRQSREAAQKSGLLGGLFGLGGGAKEASASVAASEDDGDGRMIELNLAYDRVKHALSAPLFDFGDAFEQ